MEKLFGMAKVLEEDCKLIAQDLYSNNPGVFTKKRVSLESIEASIAVMMGKSLTLRSGVLTKLRCQMEDGNNAKFS